MATGSRGRNEVYLLGSLKESLTGAKLPSVGETMSLYLHKLKTCADTKHEAVVQTIFEVEQFWQRAKIPVRPHQHAVKQLKSLMDRWEGLKKNKNRRTETQISNENDLKDTFADLFDIAHQDALKLIKIPEDRSFLIAQRERGRRGTMAGVDLLRARKEKCRIERKERTEKWIKKQKLEMSTFNQRDDEDSSEGTTDSELKPTQSTEIEKEIVRKRGRKNVLTPDVLSALDRTKTSCSKAVHTMSAVLHASQQKVEEFNINRSSIHRARQKNRCQVAEKIRQHFNPQIPLTLHFDGKMMKDVTGDEKVDRLPILVSGAGFEHLLAIPKLSSSTGANIANALMDTVTSWDLQNCVKALSFDTTASNTGHKGGACVLFERKLQSDLLYLACRHHIHEIMLQEVFTEALGPSSGPDIAIFKRFQACWPSIHFTEYQPGILDTEIAVAVLDDAADMINFASEQLQQFQPRDDYKELLELVILFLGGVPERGIHFHKPGALHRASTFHGKTALCLQDLLV